MAGKQHLNGLPSLTMPKLIFGCGYLGRRVAERWQAAGETVYVVTRTTEKASQFAVNGLRPIVADLTASGSLAAVQQLTNIDSVLFAVGFDRSSPSIHRVYVEGLSHVLSQLPDGVQKFIYISSTGVYGQAAGDTVNEASPCQPLREGGKACLAAEQLLQQSTIGNRAIILRLAGIYGPGRIPRAKDIASGAALAAPSKGWLNLIHVEDAAEIVVLAEQRATPPKLYCVSDGEPVQREDYYAELAQFLNAPPPRFTDPPPESLAAQRAGSDKRVANDLVMSELAPRFLYPTYREGLKAIVSNNWRANAP